MITGDSENFTPLGARRTIFRGRFDKANLPMLLDKGIDSAAGRIVGENRVLMCLTNLQSFVSNSANWCNTYGMMILCLKEARRVGL